MNAPNELSDEIRRVRESAQCLFNASEIDAAVERMAAEITLQLADKNPLLLTIMSGGMMPAAMLLRHLDFPLESDYIHLSRYGADTTGSELKWLRRPGRSLENRTVLLVDDLLDHGITLDTAVQACRDCGAAQVLTAVLVVKSVAKRAGLAKTDFFGLTTPDRYLFGCGMDYKHYWRNAPGIFAVRE